MSDPIDISGDGSLMKTITTEGVGDSTPQTGDKVKCHYIGTLLDGTPFDSSRDRGQLFEFTIGEGVITGWSEGVATMKKGERAIFEIQAHKAYGERGSPPKIPGGATLKFDIELFSFTPPPPQDVSTIKDGGVLLTKGKAGEGWKKPTACATVTAEITLSVDGAVVKPTETVTFVVDDGEVLEGIEQGVQSMTMGQSASLEIVPKYAFGADGDAALGVAANATVTATVAIVSFENEKAERTVDGVLAKKDQGNAIFKKKDYARAARRYEAALKLIPSPDQDDASNQAMLPCYLNAAACYLKLNKLETAKEKCNAALEIDAGSVKALYRRGCAFLELGNWDEAKADLKACLAIDSKNKGAITAMKKVQAKITGHANKQKAMFGGMFAKMGAQTAKKEAAAAAAVKAKQEAAFAERAADGWIDLCGDGSLLKKIIEEGEGEATPSEGQGVKCHYIGTLLDGTKFDSSRDRGQHFQFSIGQGVITGWSEGVATMKKGERAMFEIQAHKAYGERGSPPTIPGGATLLFDIELDSFE